MKFLLAILAVAIAGPVAANDIDKVSQAARNSFFQMSNVRVVDQITGTVWLMWHCVPFAPTGPKRSRCAAS